MPLKSIYGDILRARMNVIKRSCSLPNIMS